MPTFSLKTRCRPQSKLVPHQDPTNQLVRVYKNSFEDIILQVWSGKRYMLVNVYPGEARAIANELLACADSINQPEV